MGWRDEGVDFRLQEVNRLLRQHCHRV